MYRLNVIDQRLLGEKDHTTETTFEALASTRCWSQFVRLLNVARRLVFSVALEITIIALKWEMSPMHLLHVFQPRPFGWKCNNAFFTLISTACKYVQMSLTFHMVFLHVICNLLHGVWGNFTFSAEKLFSQPENYQIENTREKICQNKPGHPVLHMHQMKGQFWRQLWKTETLAHVDMESMTSHHDLERKIWNFKSWFGSLY